MATISSLGAGSGVLTQSVIDQLKASDTSAIITPINNKISTNQQQQQAVTLLQSQAMSVSTALSSLQGKGNTSPAKDDSIQISIGRMSLSWFLLQQVR